MCLHCRSWGKDFSTSPYSDIIIVFNRCPQKSTSNISTSSAAMCFICNLQRLPLHVMDILVPAREKIKTLLDRAYVSLQQTLDSLTFVTSYLLGNFACSFFVCSFVSKSTVPKNSFRNTIIVSNILDPDQARRFVGPDLDPNRLQKLSADDPSRQ